MLRLDLPWLPDALGRIGGLAVMRGRDDVLTYKDGISLQVAVLDPASYTSANGLVAAARLNRLINDQFRDIAAVGSVHVRELPWRSPG